MSIEQNELLGHTRDTERDQGSEVGRLPSWAGPGWAVLTCDHVEEDPHRLLHPGEGRVRGVGADEVGADDVHHHVELERVGEEDRHAEHAQRHLGQRRLRQVEGDGGRGLGAVAEVAEEAHRDVETGDGHHGEVENTGPAQHVLTRGSYNVFKKC